MRKAIISEDYWVNESYRIIRKAWKVKKSSEFPEGIEFAFQLLKKQDDRFIHLTRIDNQLHEGYPGTHIHTQTRVIWRKMTLDEAYETIMRQIK